MVKITYRVKKGGVSMRITKSGDVSVSAPIGMPEKAVLAFIESNRDWIEKAQQAREAQNARNDDFFGRLPLVTAQQCNDATQRLNNLIPPLIRKYEEIIGVRVSGISYRRTKTRWGSCNPRTRHINFSVYLLLLPEWCVEHVVVHEMTHILVPNHSPAFYAKMDQFFPRWREARAETKRIYNLDEAEDDL